MKLAITAQGENLDAAMDPRFGRCRFFIFIDMDTGAFEAKENEGLLASGGAGPQSAQFLADNGADAVITGNIGPNAMRALQSVEIKVYVMSSGTVREALEAYEKGELQMLSDASVGSHFGMGRR
ncbi:MAG: dinitrogenase iron-molybdenum cofactor biosynthesis protein [Firmicutes bacterium]|nr:dinitrogenase iron-molybdenum cofactor biosynthesis protein [Bacillota bacterium]